MSASLDGGNRVNNENNDRVNSEVEMIPVMIVEDENGSDAARAHHEHDAAKIHAWKKKK